MDYKRYVPIEQGTPIHHDVYGDGVCVDKQDDVITVQFDDKTELLSLQDYEYDWIIKPYYDYVLEENGISDRTILQENIHILNLQDEVNKKIDVLIKEINDYKKETELFDAIHLDVLNDQRKEYREIVKRPYFGRIDLQSSKDEKLGKTYYIGEHEYGDILHWASPLALPYHLPYLYLDHDHDLYLNLKRIFELKKKQIHKIKDIDLENISRPKREEVIEVCEESLPDIIEENRNEEIHNIVRSLQVEQYAIISADKDNHILVLGVAGSGKTMVLAHRIAYLTYNDQNYNQENTYIVSPTLLTKEAIKNIDLDIHKAHHFSTSEMNEYLLKKIISHNQLSIQLKDDYLLDSLLEKETVRKLYSVETYKYIDDIFNQIKNQHGKYYEEYHHYLEKRLDVVLNDSNEYKEYKKIRSILNHINRDDLESYKNELEKEYNDAINSDSNLIKENLLKSLETKCPALTELDNYQINALINQYHADINLIDELLYCINLTLNDDFYKDLKNHFYNVKKQYQILIEESKQFPLFNRDRNIKISQLKGQLFILKDKIQLYLKPVNDILLNYDLSLKGYDLVELQDRLNSIKDTYNSLYAPIIQYDEILHSHIEVDFNEKDAENRNQIVEKYFYVRTLLDHDELLTSSLHESVDTYIESLMKLRKDVVSFMISTKKKYESKNVAVITESLEDQLIDMSLVTRYILSTVKQEYQITDYYEFELFMMLYILSKVYNKPLIQDGYIYFDEIQDYSYIELKTYQNICQNTVFNYFGDMHQTLTLKGFSKDELILLTEDFKLYSIDYNYRNAKEISDYLSSEFNVDSNNIDLKGKIYKVKDIKEFITQLGDDISSTAIIISDASSKFFIKEFDYYPNINIVDEKHLALSDTKINVIKASLSKGLEFKNVLVVSRRMSEKERYVSSSRALENLYLIEE